jgi:hypothetical protein
VWTANDGMQNLGALDPFNHSRGVAINNPGQVAGICELRETGGARDVLGQHACLWSAR